MGAPIGSERSSVRRVRAAQVTWLALALAVLIVRSVTLVMRRTEFETVCHRAATCPSFQLGVSAAHTLSSYGISPSTFAIYSTAVIAVEFILWYGLAGLIIWRKPQHRGAVLAAFFLTIFPLISIVDWISLDPSQSNDLAGAFIATLLIFALLFPDGRFAPHWTRWLAVILVVAMTLAFLPLPAVLKPIEFLSFFAILAVFLAVPIAQIYRYRTISSWEERQQTKWALFGIVGAITGFLALQIVPNLVDPSLVNSDSLYAYLDNNIGGSIVFSCIPVCIAIAVLRSRLWDIDRIINRVLVYGALSISLAAIYIGSVIGLQALFRLVVGSSSSLAIALSTLVIAALFGPLHRRIQTEIDRRFYRRKYDAARVLAAFGERLRDEVDLHRLSLEMSSVVHEVLQPAQVSLWLRDARDELARSAE